MTRETKQVSRKRVIIPSCLAVLFAAAFAAVFLHGGYADKVMAKLGIRRNEVPVSWETGWDRCLAYMGVDADIVFFGDSITSGGDFNAFFPEAGICNLGVPGDTIRGMTDRAGMIATVKPEKVFVLGGINSLCDSSFDTTFGEYRTMLEKIGEATDAAVYIQGILPVSAKQEKRLFVKNTTIIRFNEKLAELAREKGYTYIDLPGRFLLNGAMNLAYTTEGIHLSGEGYRIWADAIAGYIR